MIELYNVLFIPDGSRRAARRGGISYPEAYRMAAKKVDMTVKYFLSSDSVNTVVVYGLSYDNMVGRPPSELADIFQVQEEQYKLWLNDPFFSQNRVKVTFLGSFKLFFRCLSPSYVKIMNNLEQKTRDHDWKKLIVLIGYSGRRETKRYDLSEGKRPFLKEIVHVEPPELDIVVRTGGMTRLSDALPEHTAYSELYFIDRLITDVEPQDLEMALETLKHSVRTMGR